MKLSCYLIVKNEENRLERTLRAAAKVADEIVVVDSGSTDGTLDIARRYTGKVVFHEWKSYCDQKHYAETLCSNDWVLMLDADEVLSEPLIDEINAFKAAGPKADAYNLRIVNMYPFDDKPQLFSKSFNVVRLYDKTRCTLPPDRQNKDRVFVPKGVKIGQMKGKVLHYSLLSLEQAVAKYNEHSSELMRMMQEKGRRVSAFRLYVEWPLRFVRYFFFQGYFLTGTRGFMQAVVLTTFRWLKVAKAYEAQLAEEAEKKRKQ